MSSLVRRLLPLLRRRRHWVGAGAQARDGSRTVRMMLKEEDCVWNDSFIHIRENFEAKVTFKKKAAGGDFHPNYVL
jgi:hypothetical protein